MLKISGLVSFHFTKCDYLARMQLSSRNHMTAYIYGAPLYLSYRIWNLLLSRRHSHPTDHDNFLLKYNHTKINIAVKFNSVRIIKELRKVVIFCTRCKNSMSLLHHINQSGTFRKQILYIFTKTTGVTVIPVTVLVVSIAPWFGAATGISAVVVNQVVIQVTGKYI